MGNIVIDITYGGEGLRAVLRRWLTEIFTPSDERRARERQFAALLKDHGNIISGICFSYSNSQEDMKDLRQDILLNIWKGLETFRGESSPTTWLYRVALNTCVSTIRKKKRQPATVAFDGLSDIAEQRDTTSECLLLLHQLIAGLSPVDKGIITMWLDERSYDEIAEVIGISRSNVAVRINRMKKKMAQQLKS